MSDFDKEAERERLREEYEREQADREATEKMSELLLQGATMTNAHCSECGDPIFRYDDQEFCATCERAIDRETDEADEDEDGDIEVTAPDADTRVRFGAGENGGDSGEEPAAVEPAPEETERGGPEPTETPDRPARTPPAEAAEADQAAPAGDDELAAARASLVRQLGRLTSAAESASDPRDAEAYLSAAREAAETLAALRR